MEPENVSNEKGVFGSLGFDPDEAANLAIRSELMIRISEFIRHRKLTQAEAAKTLGVTQPRVSDLVRGKIDLFSIDALVNMAQAAGMRVTLEVSAR